MKKGNIVAIALGAIGAALAAVAGVTAYKTNKRDDNLLTDGETVIDADDAVETTESVVEE